MTDNAIQDPAEIESEIRRTQDNMSRTVDRIGEQLSIKNVFNALLDKADENNVDARMLVDGARRNPIALGLIAAGAIWLVSDKDSKLPTFPSASGKNDDELDVDHRDYISHMSAIEQRPDEDGLSYQRRRDIARSNFFMIERGHEEDDGGFRKRLDEMTARFRDKRHAWSESTTRAQSVAMQTGQKAIGRVQDIYEGNPLVGGILAALVGAAFGSAVPITEQEQDKLGGIGGKVRDVIDENKDKVTTQLRETKDELLEKAGAAIQPPADRQAPTGGGSATVGSALSDTIVE